MDRGTWWTPVHGDIIEVIERVHTTGWFMQNHLFPTLLEAGKSQTKELTDSVPTENPVTSLQDEPQAGIKIVGRNINNLRYADDTTLMPESEEELKSLLMQVKVESEKVGLKLNIQKMKIMASGPITSWEIDGETVSDFIFWAPESLQMVTAAMKLRDAYSLEGKLCPT